MNHYEYFITRFGDRLSALYACDEMGNYYSCDTYFGCNRNKWVRANWKPTIDRIKKYIESVRVPGAEANQRRIITRASEEDIQKLGILLITPETLVEQKQYEYYRSEEWDDLYLAQDEDWNFYKYEDERNNPNVPWEPKPIHRHWQIKAVKNEGTLRGSRNYREYSEEMLKEQGIPLIDPDKLTEWK